jgi:thiol-disulfide isomerase/thioredoxin
MRVRPAAIALLVAALLGVSACGDAAEPQAAAPQAAAQQQEQEQEQGTPETLAFTGTTLEGEPFDAASLAGRPTVLWFWAPWCATCFGQAASVADMQAAHGTKVNLLGIAGLGDAKEMKEFVADGEVGAVTHLNDKPGTVWKKFGIVEQSIYVILDKDGKIVHKGWMDSIDFEGKVAELAA